MVDDGKLPVLTLHVIPCMKRYGIDTFSKMVRGKLIENNSPNATRRKQLVEIKGRKTHRKQLAECNSSKTTRRN